MPQISKELVMDWGAEAASNLINHNISLNDSVTKIASENHLNIDQIARTVEAANIAMHTSVYKNNSYPEFETASLPVVASRLSMPMSTKEASLDDYDTPPDAPLRHMKTASAMWSSEESEETSATKHRATQHQKELEKRAQERYDEAVQDFYDAASDLKQAVIQYALNPDTQENSLPLVKAAAYNYSPKELLPAVRLLFEDIEQELSAKMPPTLFKSASSVQNIDETMVLNTNHTLVTKLAAYYDSIGKVAALVTQNEIQNLPGRKKWFGWKTKGILGLGATALLGTAAYKSGQRDAYSRMGAMQYPQPQMYKR